MSHFTVMLKITPDRLSKYNGNVEAAVEEMLAPYQENNMNDCPEQYLKFYDCTENINTDWDSLTEEERAEYKNKAEFATEGCGYKEHDGKFGRWENPNRKWDWYQIGGRWSGSFPVKPNVIPRLGERSWTLDNEPEESCRADICRVDELDLDKVATETREAAEKYWNKWEMYKRGESPKNDPRFNYSVRSRAFSLGILVLAKRPELVPDGWISNAWEWGQLPPEDERHTWIDAISPISYDQFMEKYIDCFNPVGSYAALDDDGWHAPGEVGWFGYTSDEPEQLVQFKREFWKRFIKNATPDTTLVMVDCHI